MTDKILVTTTCSSEEEAKRVAHAVVEQRLAACAQIMPGLTSVYHWKGAVETSSEWLVTFKTRNSLFGQLEATVRQNHSYEVPELVATSISAASAAYDAWMDDELHDQAR